ncbi:type II secretion system F family protein [Spelaeicoccus albus]|uniref:Tight adherence protein C n=1 Tax=Spelaeicoccus albus TaxID=1280376 RepID=A0A7Z0IJB8_9MICO|nr:type II secretion system F family protein [Spelaeicoccus albus]NYI69262.1 tight adherence protein C [Spelaeicoccus albus]
MTSLRADGPLLAVVAGLALGIGLALIVYAAPIGRRPALTDRLAPYLRDQPRASRLLDAAGAAPAPFGVFTPVLNDIGARLGRLYHGTASIRRRLDRLGSDLSVEHFRAEQVIYAALGLVAGLAAGLLLAAARGVGAPVVALLMALGAAGGALLRDHRLSRAVARREEAMTAEFPTVAELLALAVAAGEGPAAAIDRITRSCGGELSRELARALADTSNGVSLIAALDAVAARTGLSSVARFVEGVTIALERGTPLAGVLRAQAADVRETARRDLMEASGRKEVGMLVPVVVFVLPITVVFAIFPSLAVLDMSFG